MVYNKLGQGSMRYNMLEQNNVAHSELGQNSMAYNGLGHNRTRIYLSGIIVNMNSRYKPNSVSVDEDVTVRIQGYT